MTLCLEGMARGNRIKWILFTFLAITLLTAASANAQSCTAATCTAADMTFASVQAALPSPSNTNATVVVNLPAGTGTWTTGQCLNYTVTSAVTKLTIQGQSSIATLNSDGRPATFKDTTVILDHTGCPSYINISTAAGQTVRVTGITDEVDSGSPSTTNCQIGFGGKGQVRIDHVHFFNNGQAAAECYAIIYGSVTGVSDHNLFSMSPTQVQNGIRIDNNQTSFGDTSGNANGSWSNPTAPGTASGYWFFEDNTFVGGISNDCNNGGRQVFRHNTFNNASLQTHEMTGDARGCRATEVYLNTFNGVNGDGINSFTAMGCRMGTCLVWGNVSHLMENLLAVSNDRTNGHPFNTSQTGYGYCGTNGSIAGPSNWDFSQGTNGYPCIDQPSRGQSDVLSGNFPNKCNLTTNPSCNIFTGQWPHNKLEPIYEWLNQFQIGEGSGWVRTVYDIVAPLTGAFTQNQDYYQYTLSWNGSAFTGTAFNGTVGTGSGLLSARPSTCTAGPGGAEFTSPTGSYGVAYWGTDTNTLYICTATNTWTGVYTPYTYPHPLVTGSQTSGALAPPTNLVVTVN